MPSIFYFCNALIFINIIVKSLQKEFKDKRVLISIIFFVTSIHPTTNCVFPNFSTNFSHFWTNKKFVFFFNYSTEKISLKKWGKQDLWFGCLMSRIDNMSCILFYMATECLIEIVWFDLYNWDCVLAVLRDQKYCVKSLSSIQNFIFTNNENP